MPVTYDQFFFVTLVVALTRAMAEGNIPAVRSLMSATATHPDVGLDHLFVPLNRSCHPECVKRGNCNAEEGRCECPFGYTGPACEQSLLPGCQLGPNLEPFFGVLVPRNCECLRQANKFFGCTPENDTCTHTAFLFHDVSCYSYTGLPSSEQWSRAPVLDQSGVEFFRGPIRRLVKLDPVGQNLGLVGRDIWDTPHLSLPLENCGQHKCQGRGACVILMQRGADVDLGAIRTAASSGTQYCMCYKGYKGHTCGEVMENLCPNLCRGRGRCIRGFCHCRPPYWGLDCGRERAWQLAPGATLVPNRLVLRIYVYDLPANIAFPLPLDDNVFDINENFYQTHRKFTEMLLMDSAVRTGRGCTQVRGRQLPVLQRQRRSRPHRVGYRHNSNSAGAAERYAAIVAADGDSPGRDKLFFFAGSVRQDDPTYSGGVRQALHEHLKALMASGGDISDIEFIEGFTNDFTELLSHSRFCLAPHGAGFGVRLTLAMIHACVPVIIQDQVYQPYESDGLLPYNQFSVRLSKSDIPHIVPILRAVPPDKLRRMRLAMAKYYRAFLWESALGGQAYNYTIMALNMRLSGLWGHLWGDPHTEPDINHASGGRRRHLLRVAWAPEDGRGGLI